MCMVDYRDNESQSLGEKRHMARKAHRCGDCSRTINPGERYRICTWVGDWGIWTCKQCAHCEAASEWLQVVCRGFLFDAVGEDLRQHWDEEFQLRSLDLGRLCVGHRRGWSGITPEQVTHWARDGAERAKRMMETVSA